MTKSNTGQTLLDLESNILDILIDLRSNHGFGNREMAEKLGVDESYLSRVFNKKQVGGRQLYAGLSLLLELTILKQSGVRTNPDLQRELDQMKRRIGEIEAQISTRYPEHQPQSAALNPPRASAEEPSSSDRAMAEARARQAGAAYDAKRGKHKPS